MQACACLRLLQDETPCCWRSFGALPSFSTGILTLLKYEADPHYALFAGARSRMRARRMPRSWRSLAAAPARLDMAAGRRLVQPGALLLPRRSLARR